MAKTPSHMRNLTLASAKHLMKQGHITPQHHAKIIAAAGVPPPPKMPKLPARPFGALAKRPAAPLPMPGGQASLPGVPGVTPPSGIGAPLSPGFMADEG